MVPDQPPQGFPACVMSFGSIRARKKLTIRLTGVLGCNGFRSCWRPDSSTTNDLYNCPNQFRPWLSVALFHPALTREASMFEAGDQDRETNRHVDRIQDRHQIGRGEIGKHERLAR